MNRFYLTEVPRLQDEFPTMPLTRFRGLVDAAIADMKITFDCRDQEIDAWAAGDMEARQKMIHRYGRYDDAELYHLEAMKHFDTILEAFARREQEALRNALASRQSAA